MLIYGAQNPRVPQQIAAETGIKLLRLYSNGGEGGLKPILTLNGLISPCARCFRRLMLTRLAQKLKRSVKSNSSKDRGFVIGKALILVARATSL